MDYQSKLALVTGASSGLGAAYAAELARRGSNLILVARRKSALDKLALELTKGHGVDVTVIEMDLSEPDSADRLLARLKETSLSPDILINNAGFGTSGRLAGDDPKRIQDEVTLNVVTLVNLTRMLLPAMLERNSGAIVNIASTAAYQPVPGMAVYAATKAFVLSFTEAVWGETRKSNVRVLAVSPGATATEFFDVAGAKPSTGLAPISAVIETTFKALDAKTSTPSVIVGGRNALLAGLSKLMPKKTVIAVAASMFLKD